MLRSSGINRQSGTLIVRIARKKNGFLLFCYFENLSIAHNFGTTDLILIGFSAKCISSNGLFNQIENWKWHMFHFRLIPQDYITYLFLTFIFWKKKVLLEHASFFCIFPFFYATSFLFVFNILYFFYIISLIKVEYYLPIRCNRYFNLVPNANQNAIILH